MINADYINKVEDIYVDGSSSVFEINSLDYFDAEQYDIYDDKDYARFIKDTETICRTSFEYRQLINYLRFSEGMNTCSFLNNVTNVDSNKVKIEIHHAPLSLYDICSAVIKKRLHNRESIDIFNICKEIMFLHYMGYVGLIPLSESVHQMVHNSFIFIPVNLVRGNWREFVNQYYDFISPEVLDSIDSAEEMTKQWLDDISGENNIVDQQKQIFNLHTTYIKYKNIETPTNTIPEAKDIIKDKISNLKNQKKRMYRLIKKPS